MTGGGASYNEEYTRCQAERSVLRRLVRRFYLRHTLRYVGGKAVDFGCGVGSLLTLLPPGSIGYEINEATVRHCRERGLDVRLYRPEVDRYRFEDCRRGEFSTFIMVHVLEHLELPQDVLRTVMGSCLRLGIGRVIVVVPGRKGFRHDETHRTFVDRDYIDSHGMRELEGYRIVHEGYFPIPLSRAGSFFTHNEYMMVYDRIH